MTAEVSRLVAGGLLVVVFAFAPGFAGVACADEFDELLAKLADEEQVVREDAEKQLLKKVRAGALTREQVAKLQSAALQTEDQEVRSRASRLFANFVTGSTSGSTILDKTRVQVSDYQRAGQKFTFTFDDSVRGGVTDDAGKALFNDLQEKSKAVKDAVLRGDAAAAGAALAELETFVTNLDDAQFASLNLKEGPNDDVPVTKAKVLQLIREAKETIPTFRDDIQRKGGNPAPPPPGKKRVELPGLIDLGPTFRFGIAEVISPGALDVSFPPVVEALALPPAGLEFVGHLVSLVPDDALIVSGTVLVGIEYGELQLIGHRVRSPDLLQLLRFADGEFQLLALVDNDLTNHVLFASYVTSAGDAGTNQFGQFAIVQPVPEPPLFVLALVSGIALIGVSGCRRRSGRREESQCAQ
jgi:hypothetical protein